MDINLMVIDVVVNDYYCSGFSPAIIGILPTRKPNIGTEDSPHDEEALSVIYYLVSVFHNFSFNY